MAPSISHILSLLTQGIIILRQSSGLSKGTGIEECKSLHRYHEELSFSGSTWWAGVRSVVRWGGSILSVMWAGGESGLGKGLGRAVVWLVGPIKNALVAVWKTDWKRVRSRRCLGDRLSRVGAVMRGWNVSLDVKEMMGSYGRWAGFEGSLDCGKQESSQRCHGFAKSQEQKWWTEEELQGDVCVGRGIWRHCLDQLELEVSVVGWVQMPLRQLEWGQHRREQHDIDHMRWLNPQAGLEQHHWPRTEAQTDWAIMAFNLAKGACREAWQRWVLPT